jgi:hypothetical protein
MSNINLENLFKKLQTEMLATLGINDEISHPVDKGDISEDKWNDFLNRYLPKRYTVSKGTVVDHKGNASQQIDLVIYDNLYAPLIFNDGARRYIPAESVYAVFEVKPEINKEYIDYSVSKIESVRKLKRTNTDIYHAGGRYEPKQEKDRFQIMGGILGTRSWENFNDKIKEYIAPLQDQKQINIGCSLQKGSFTNFSGNLMIGTSDYALMTFFTQLHEELRKMATASPMDINQYYQFK